MEGKAYSHERGTLTRGSDPHMTCDGCNERFPAEQHPVEPDHYDSPLWVAHVKAHRPSPRGWTVRQLVVLVLAVSALTWWLSPWRAYGDTSPTTGLVVSTHKVVKSSTLPHCTFEDGSGSALPCSWNFDHTDGNGRGLAYWIDRQRVTHYVWPTHPVWSEWLTKRMRQRMSHAHGHTARWWKRCAVWWLDDQPSIVRCPDGTKVRLS